MLSFTSCSNLVHRSDRIILLHMSPIIFIIFHLKFSSAIFIICSYPSFSILSLSSGIALSDVCFCLLDLEGEVLFEEEEEEDDI